MTPSSYHGYSVSRSSSQQCGGIPLKLLCLFSSILVHHKTLQDSRLLKYLSIKNSWLSVTWYKPKLSHGLTCHFMLDSLHWCVKQRNRTSVLLGELWYTCQSIYTLTFSNVLLVLALNLIVHKSSYCKCSSAWCPSGVSWGVHSVRLHPGGSKWGAKKEGRKRKKQGKGEKKGKEKGRQRRRKGKGKKICKRKGKEGRNQKKIGYKKKNTGGDP